MELGEKFSVMLPKQTQPGKMLPVSGTFKPLLAEILLKAALKGARHFTLVEIFFSRNYSTI